LLKEAWFIEPIRMGKLSVMPFRGDLPTNPQVTLSSIVSTIVISNSTTVRSHMIIRTGAISGQLLLEGLMTDNVEPFIL
jgi:hypothetical protein